MEVCLCDLVVLSPMLCAFLVAIGVVCYCGCGALGNKIFLNKAHLGIFAFWCLCVVVFIQILWSFD